MKVGYQKVFIGERTASGAFDVRNIPTSRQLIKGDHA